MTATTMNEDDGVDGDDHDGDGVVVMVVVVVMMMGSYDKNQHVKLVCCCLKHTMQVRNISEGKNVSMYITNRDCEKAGDFYSKLVVSMRPMPAEKVEVVHHNCQLA